MKNKKLFLVFFIIFHFYSMHADSTNPMDISGIWENYPYRHFNKGIFSWGESVYSTGSIIIDLNANKPHLSCLGGSFYISAVKYNNDRVELTGVYSDKPKEMKKIIIHIINADSISIELIDQNIAWLMSQNDKNTFYRVPKDAPYEPLGPEGI